MTEPRPEGNHEGPFDWMFTSMTEWGRLLMAAQELRGIDNEHLETLLNECAGTTDPTGVENADKVRNLVMLLRSLDIDPNAIRASAPETMQTLEAACSGCTERSRCDSELAQGTAALTFPEFCPNVQRLNTLASIQSATQTP